MPISRSRGLIFPFSLHIAAAFVVALLLSGLPAAANEEESSSDADATGLTDAECQGGWAESEADDTCRNENVTAEGSMCRIQAVCKPASVLVVLTPDDGEKQKKPAGYPNDITVSLDDVDDLRNCNGVLTVGNC